MALKFYGATVADPGEWFPWRKEVVPLEDGSTREDVLEVRVRRLPPAEAQRIDVKHFGRKRRVMYGKEALEQDLDRVAQIAATAEKAAYCMVETRGFDFEIPSEEDAAQLSRLLGAPVKAGSVVNFDGRWMHSVKEYIFAGLPELADWVVEKARKLRGEDQEEEAETAKN